MGNHTPVRAWRSGIRAGRPAAFGAAVLLTAAALPLAAQTRGGLERDAEIRLAMSAGPPAVSEHADVWVFGASGFERAVRGSNGFACMVVRTAGDAELLAPHCFSPDAVESVLPAKLEEGRLIARGLSTEEVNATLMEHFDDGSLPLPTGNAFAYMLSSGQRLGPAGKWKPHFMLYVPYLTNEDVGGSQETPWYPFVGPVTGHPHSTLVVVTTEFVNPDDITLPPNR